MSAVVVDALGDAAADVVGDGLTVAVGEGLTVTFGDVLVDGAGVVQPASKVTHSTNANNKDLTLIKFSLQILIFASSRLFA